MTKQEFEALTGKAVDIMVYAYIEEVYVNCGDMDKEEFCKHYSKILSNPIFDYYYSRCRDLEQSLSDQGLSAEVVAADLINKSVELDNEELCRCAIALIGQKAYLSYKLDRGLNLNSYDRELLKEFLL